MSKRCDCYEEKYNPFDGDVVAAICNGTKERNICDCGGDLLKCDFYAAVRQKASYIANKEVILGVSPDAPVVENENGGKQSDSPYAFHLLPTSSIFAAAEVVKVGAEKYGEKFGDRNYTKIPTEEHVNHAIAHLYAYLAGDKSDDHLSHAICRTMFAYDTDKRRDSA